MEREPTYHIVYYFNDNDKAPSTDELLIPQYSSLPGELKPSVDQNVINLLNKRNVLVGGRVFMANINTPELNQSSLCFFSLLTHPTSPEHNFLICFLLTRTDDLDQSMELYF